MHYKEILEHAYCMLARREHSQKELRQKLRRYTQDPAITEQIIDHFISANLQSDQRFTEQMIQSYLNKGQGPIKLMATLKHKHDIDPEIIDRCLDSAEPDWQELLQSVRIKRFGHVLPSTPKDQAKQYRFLSQRGFADTQIRALLQR